MGALNTPEITGLLENTPALRDLDLDRFDAIVVAGGQAPMFQYRDHEDLKRAIARFYEAGKPTAGPLPRRQRARRREAVRRLVPHRGPYGHRVRQRRGGLQ